MENVVDWEMNDASFQIYFVHYDPVPELELIAILTTHVFWGFKF